MESNTEHVTEQRDRHGDTADYAALPVATTTIAPSSLTVHRPVSVQLGGRKQRDPAASVCHVCGRAGHCAGFVGSVYVDCPFKPCYLCKQEGHTTMECPFRIQPQAQRGGQGRKAAAGGACEAELQAEGYSARAGLRGMLRSASPVTLLATSRPLLHSLLPSSSLSPLGCVHLAPAHAAWPRTPTATSVPALWRVESAVLRLHSRRIACALIPSTAPSLCVTGDKGGELGLWSTGEGARGDRQVYGAHRYLINALAEDCVGSTAASLRVWSASADGTVRLQYPGRRCWYEALDLNPGGWTGDEKAWRMAYSIAAPGGQGQQTNAHCPVLAGDDQGRVWGIDARLPSHSPVGWVQAHDKGGNKVNSLQYNPVQPGLVVSASADWTVRLWDVRRVSWAGPAEGNACAGSGDSLGLGLGTSLPALDASLSSTVSSPSRPNTLVQALAPPPAGAAVIGSGQGGQAQVDDDEEEGMPGRREREAAEVGSPSPGKGKAGSSATKRPRAPRAAPTGPGTLQPLSILPHPRVVMHAAFSPWTGQRLLTTCADNRLRLWMDVAGAACGGHPPARELPHSHDWSRYLSPFRGHWYTPDESESSVVVGRYISESFTARSGATLALHPVDIIGIGRGGMVPADESEPLPSPPASSSSPPLPACHGSVYRPDGPLHVLAQLADPLQDKICPVVAIHPHSGQHTLLSAASGSVYMWRPLARGQGDWRAARQRGSRGWRRQEGVQAEEDSGSSGGSDGDDSNGGDPRALVRPTHAPGPDTSAVPAASPGHTGKGGKGGGKGRGKAAAGGTAAVAGGASTTSAFLGPGGGSDSASLLEAWRAGLCVLEGPGTHHGRGSGALPLEGGAEGGEEGEEEGAASGKGKKRCRRKTGAGAGLGTPGEDEEDAQQ